MVHSYSQTFAAMKQLWPDATIPDG